MKNEIDKKHAFALPRQNVIRQTWTRHNVTWAKCYLGKIILEKLELGKSYQSKMLPRQNFTRQKVTEAKCCLGKILLSKLELGKMLPRQNVA